MISVPEQMTQEAYDALPLWGGEKWLEARPDVFRWESIPGVAGFIDGKPYRFVIVRRPHPSDLDPVYSVHAPMNLTIYKVFIDG